MPHRPLHLLPDQQRGSGQFERTLIVAEGRRSVSYLEGCTAPQFDTNQLHAAVVELVALDDAKTSSIRRSRNWYTRRQGRPGRHLQLVTKRGLLQGPRLQDQLDPGGDGLRHRLEVSGCVLLGENSVGEFYSVALTNHKQADTGTEIVHVGRNTKSTIVARASAQARAAAGALVKVTPKARGPQLQPVRFHADRPAVQRQHLPLHRGAEQVGPGGARGPLPQDRGRSSSSTSSSAGSRRGAISMIINGFCKDVFRKLPWSSP